MAGTNIISELMEKSNADQRKQPWKQFVDENRKPEQSMVEMVKTGGTINVMTNLLYVLITLSYSFLVATILISSDFLVRLKLRMGFVFVRRYTCFGR